MTWDVTQFDNFLNFFLGISYIIKKFYLKYILYNLNKYNKSKDIMLQ